MTTPTPPTEDQIKALEAIKTKTFGKSSNRKYVKLSTTPTILYFENWAEKDEHGEFKNMWEEEVTGKAEDGSDSYKVAVFNVLDLTVEPQEQKTLSVSSKRLFGKIERMLTKGFSTLEITKIPGSTTYDTDYDVIPAGASSK